jgi:hypothetical protein
MPALKKPQQQLLPSLTTRGTAKPRPPIEEDEESKVKMLSISSEDDDDDLP